MSSSWQAMVIWVLLCTLTQIVQCMLHYIVCFSGCVTSTDYSWYVL